MLNAKLKNINECLSKSEVRKIDFLRASASQKGLKGKNTRLKHQSEQFWGAQNSSNCCLRSRIFSCQSFLACRGSQKLHFVDLGLT